MPDLNKTSRVLSLTRLFLTTLFVASAFVPAGRAEDTVAAAPRTISIDEIERGQRGYGLSVFAGSEPERFELEVLGVVRNMRPELSYILARLEGQNLEHTGVIAGMSGSPVYIDGRLAGAVAFSYNFSLDPIAGITPIGAMHQIGNLELSGAVPRGQGPDVPEEQQVSFTDVVERKVDMARLDAALERLRPPSVDGGRSMVQWSAGGFGAATRGRLQAVLGNLAPVGAFSGGAAAADTVPRELVPGSPVAIPMVRGDLNLAASGTVTDRRGDEIFAFGHPVFDQGPSALPMATSEVVTVIPSRFSSFKVSNAGELIGTFDMDREAGSRGHLGTPPPMIPVTIRLSGLTERVFHTEIMDLPIYLPSLVAVTAMGALESGSFLYGAQGLDMEARFQLGEHGDLRLEQSFDSQSGAMEGIIYLFTYAGFLGFTDLAELSVEGVEIDFRQTDRTRTATLVAAHADKAVAAPGETVRLTLEFQAYRGERYRRTLETVVPAQIDDGRYLLLVGDGTTMDAARLSVEKIAPDNIEEALRYLNGLRSRRELRLLGLVGARGASLAGESLPDLPGSVRSILAGAGPTTATALGLAIVHRQGEKLDVPIAGIQRVDLEVRRK